MNIIADILAGIAIALHSVLIIASFILSALHMDRKCYPQAFWWLAVTSLFLWEGK